MKRCGRIQGHTWEREAQQLKGEAERVDLWCFFSWPLYNLFTFLLLGVLYMHFKVLYIGDLPFSGNVGHFLVLHVTDNAVFTVSVVVKLKNHGL
jgi:hypothetical protein